LSPGKYREHNMRKIFQLQEAKIDEVSFVTAPANKKQFLFKKSVSLSRVSKGRIICSSCDHEETLIGFLKSASEDCPQCGTNLISSNSKIVFNGDKIMKLTKLFKSFLGDDEDLVDEKEFKILEKSEENIDKDIAKAISDSLESLSEYSDDFPDAQKADIVNLAKIAISEAGKTEKKEDSNDDEDVKKAGAKLSKSTVTIIKSAISKLKDVPEAVKALQGLVPKATEKADIETLTKTVEALTKAIENNDPDETKTEKEKKTDETDLEKQLKNINDKINKIAKAGGVKQSLTEDEEDEDEEDAGKEETKKGKKWGFVIGGRP